MHCSELHRQTHWVKSLGAILPRLVAKSYLLRKVIELSQSKLASHRQHQSLWGLPVDFYASVRNQQRFTSIGNANYVKNIVSKFKSRSTFIPKTTRKYIHSSYWWIFYHVNSLMKVRPYRRIKQLRCANSPIHLCLCDQSCQPTGQMMRTNRTCRLYVVPTHHAEQQISPRHRIAGDTQQRVPDHKPPLHFSRNLILRSQHPIAQINKVKNYQRAH